jgi:hypothetical protein
MLMVKVGREIKGWVLRGAGEDDGNREKHSQGVTFTAVTAFQCL